MNPPGVGGDGSKVKKKCINMKHWGDTASKGVETAHGTIRKSTLYRPETRTHTQKIIYSRIRLGPHSCRGARKREPMKVSITVSPFFHFTKRISPLVCFTISPYKLVCILCTISPYLLYHFNIMR